MKFLDWEYFSQPPVDVGSDGKLQGFFESSPPEILVHFTLFLPIFFCHENAICLLSLRRFFYALITYVSVESY